jgi:hypothetical protein
MRRDDLDAYRRRGLVVDEDFELGITPAGRAVRATLMACLMVALAASVIVVAVPERPPVPPDQRSLKSRSHPASVRPLGTMSPAPIRRGRANV